MILRDYKSSRFESGLFGKNKINPKLYSISNKDLLGDSVSSISNNNKKSL